MFMTNLERFNDVISVNKIEIYFFLVFLIRDKKNNDSIYHLNFSNLCEDMIFEC